MPSIQRMPGVMPAINRFRGCLLGTAIGDALGMPAENMTRPQILKKYGQRVDRFYPKPNQGLEAGQWTDDTLLTLATVDSLLRRRALVPSDIAFQFRLAYQREPRRGFGTSTKTALKRLERGRPWKEAGATGEYAAGSGAAMRIAPIALFSYSNLEQLKRNCELAASITHNNEEAIKGSLAIAFVIAKIINNTFDQGIILNETLSFIGPSIMYNKLANVRDILGRRERDFEKGLEEIGTSGSVFDSVGSSIFIFLCFLDSFKEALVHSVSFGGDTDTIGSMVGAMSGSYHGDQGIPQGWQAGVENGNEILAKASGLYRLSHGIKPGKP